MRLGVFLLRAAGPLLIFVIVNQIYETDAAVLSRRQVLPPIPGYIPVYIQHGDVPPEDSHEFAGIFQVADKNIPPRVLPTIELPTTTTEMRSDTEVTEPPELINTTIGTKIDDDSDNPDISPVISDSTKSEITSNDVPEESDGSMASVNKVSEINKVGSPDNDIMKETEKEGESLLDSVDKVEQHKDTIESSDKTEENAKLETEVSGDEVNKSKED